MDKRTKIIAASIALVLGLCALAWVWSSDSAPKVDPQLVESAAENTRQAVKAAPAEAPEPESKGRAKPGPIGGP